jgi:hypothetical protein
MPEDGPASLALVISGAVNRRASCSLTRPPKGPHLAPDTSGRMHPLQEGLSVRRECERVRVCAVDVRAFACVDIRVGAQVSHVTVPSMQAVATSRQPAAVCAQLPLRHLREACLWYTQHAHGRRQLRMCLITVTASLCGTFVV